MYLKTLVLSRVGGSSGVCWQLIAMKPEASMLQCCVVMCVGKIARTVRLCGLQRWRGISGV